MEYPPPIYLIFLAYADGSISLGECMKLLDERLKMGRGGDDGWQGYI